MESGEMLAWMGDCRCEPAQEFDGLEDDITLTGVPGLTQLEDNLAVGGQRQAFLGKGRAEPVS